MTPIDFATQLLTLLSKPVTPNNTQALVAAQCIEGGWMHNAALFNPLNTTLRAPGSTSITSVGVQAYTSLEQGLQATADTLTNGLYTGILDALAADADPDVTLRAMAVSPWGWYDPANPSTRYPIARASAYQSYGSHAFP
jgi:hypothetical protein